jgi:hypothetical protein
MLLRLIMGSVMNLFSRDYILLYCISIKSSPSIHRIYFEKQIVFQMNAEINSMLSGLHNIFLFHNSEFHFPFDSLNIVIIINFFTLIESLKEASRKIFYTISLDTWIRLTILMNF